MAKITVSDEMHEKVKTVAAMLRLQIQEASEMALSSWLELMASDNAAVEFYLSGKGCKDESAS